MNLQTSKRILIIGSPGSGKSTLAGILEKKLSLPVIHLDQINWKNNKETLSSQEFDEKLISILSSRVWIIDGNYNRTLELRIQAADTVIWLDFPRLLCVHRVLKRYILGKFRESSYGNPNRLEKEFISFIWHFNKTNKPNMLFLMKKYEKNCQFYQIKRPKEIKQLFV